VYTYNSRCNTTRFSDKNAFCISTVDDTCIPLNITNITEFVIPGMATKWYEMGLRLGVDERELEIIQHDTKDSKTACRMMFREWWDNTQSEKSWKILLEALCSQSVGKKTLISDLNGKIFHNQQCSYVHV